MSYVVFGRAIKSEYLALGTIFATLGAAKLASGGSKPQPKPAPGKTVIETVKDAVPINAGSSEEEQFIRQFIAEAEKEAKH